MENVLGQEGMAELALILGAGAGMGMAFALWITFGVLRKWAGKPTAFFGGLTTVFTLYVLFVALYDWFCERDGPVTLFELVLALALLGLMALFAGIAAFHRGRYVMGWSRAFLILMAEAGAAVVVSCVLHWFYFEAVTDLFCSYECANALFGFYYLTLALGLTLMEAFQLGRRTRRP